MPVKNCTQLWHDGSWFDALFSCYWASRVGGTAQLALVAGAVIAIGLWTQTGSIVMPAVVLALTGGVITAVAPPSSAMIGWLVVLVALAMGLWNLMT